jgi:hypothetical protein
VNVSEITAFCFVFHKQDILNYKTDIYGMKDVRVMNKWKYTSGIFVDAPQQDCLAFPSLYGDEKHKNSFDACHELFSSMGTLQRDIRNMVVKNDSDPGDFGASYAKYGLERTAWM